MSEATPTSALPVECPPPAPCPAKVDGCDEARLHLHALAQQITKHHSRRLLIEYLRLRRSIQTA